MDSLLFASGILTTSFSLVKMILLYVSLLKSPIGKEAKALEQNSFAGLATIFIIGLLLVLMSVMIRAYVPYVVDIPYYIPDY